MKLTHDQMASAAQGDLAALIAAGWTPSALRAAGWTPSALRAAGWTPSDLRAAGWTPSALRAAGWTPSDLEDYLRDVPLIERPYTTLLEAIKAGQRIHKQSTFGPDCDPETNLCKTPMCTAGHIVNMAGAEGYKLRDQYGWEGAARLLFERAHPEWPQQSYAAIPQEWAMAHIEQMAAREAEEVSQQEGK